MKPQPRQILVLSAFGGLISALVLWLVPAAGAVSTRSFRIDTASELSSGELEGAAVLSSGAVIRGVDVRRLDLADVSVAWCLARGEGDTVYFGTGNDGKVYRSQGDRITVFAETGQLLVSSLVNANGALYAGTVPEGRVYRIDSAGSVTELPRLEGVDHVWDLVWDARRRVVFAATGPEGRVFTIDRQGRAEVYWDSEQAHVMSLALDDDGTLYAGTSGDAVVVRLAGPGRARVLFDFPGNEITALAVREGTLAVAANEFPDPPRVAATKTKAARPPRPGPGEGQLWRVSPEGRAENVYEQDEGHFTSVAFDERGALYAGSGTEGRIVRVRPDQTSATWIDVDERQVLALDFAGPTPVFVTGDTGAFYRVVGPEAETSKWTSEVLDAEFPARFGRLTWRGSGALQVQTRSGNRQTPDTTWSSWSESIESGGAVRSPAGRFLQIRAVFPARGEAVLHAVTAYYLPQNQRSRIHDITADLETRTAKNKNKNGDGHQPPQPTSRYKLKWKTDNSDGDVLRYRLRYRQEDQTVWRDVLREYQELRETEYVWETGGLPDGWYVLEVSATDAPSNPERLAEVVRTESEPLLIDNHPPRIASLNARGLTVSGVASDALGPIAQLEYKVDGGEWRLFFPVDDLLDAAEETFEFAVGPLSEGPHIVAVRATDAGGNSAVSEVTVRAPASR